MRIIFHLFEVKILQILIAQDSNPAKSKGLWPFFAVYHVSLSNKYWVHAFLQGTSVASKEMVLILCKFLWRGEWMRMLSNTLISKLDMDFIRKELYKPMYLWTQIRLKLLREKKKCGGPFKSSCMYLHMWEKLSWIFQQCKSMFY